MEVLSVAVKTMELPLHIVVAGVLICIDCARARKGRKRNMGSIFFMLARVVKSNLSNICNSSGVLFYPEDIKIILLFIISRWVILL